MCDIWRNVVDGTDAPICQDDRLGGLDVCLARSIVCHDSLVDLAGEEAFEAPDDIACGPAASSPSCDVVDGRLVESHADDDGSIEGGVGLSVATPIEAVPAGGHPGRGRDRTRAAELREGGVRTNPVGVVPEDDQQLRRGVGADPEALGCLHRSLLIRQPVSEPTASSASTARLRQIPWAGRSRTRARRPQRYVA